MLDFQCYIIGIRARSSYPGNTKWLWIPRWKWPDEPITIRYICWFRRTSCHPASFNNSTTTWGATPKRIPLSFKMYRARKGMPSYHWYWILHWHSKYDLGWETRSCHIQPYKSIQAQMDESEEKKVSKQVEVPCSIGNYRDKITCDIAPMEAGHILLGRAWQYDNGRTNHQSFTLNNQKFHTRSNEAIWNLRVAIKN